MRPWQLRSRSRHGKTVVCPTLLCLPRPWKPRFLQGLAVNLLQPTSKTWRPCWPPWHLPHGLERPWRPTSAPAICLPPLRQPWWTTSQRPCLRSEPLRILTPSILSLPRLPLSLLRMPGWLRELSLRQPSPLARNLFLSTPHPPRPADPALHRNASLWQPLRRRSWRSSLPPSQAGFCLICSQPVLAGKRRRGNLQL